MRKKQKTENDSRHTHLALQVGSWEWKTTKMKADLFKLFATIIIRLPFIIMISWILFKVIEKLLNATE